MPSENVVRIILVTLGKEESIIKDVIIKAEKLTKQYDVGFERLTRLTAYRLKCGAASLFP